MMRVLALTLCLAVGAWGYPTGAAMTACADMTPQHTLPPLQEVAPFEILTSDRGDFHQVTINSLGPWFRGFMIQARDGVSGMPLGGFAILPDEMDQAHYMQCGTEHVDDTVTHSSNDPKQTIAFEWYSRAAPLANVRFVVTIVETYDRYWVGLESEMIG